MTAEPLEPAKPTPSQARRARRRIPLAERAAVTGLRLDKEPQDDGRALRAFFSVVAKPANAEPAAPVQVSEPPEPQPAPEPPPAVQVPPAVLAATLSAPQRLETEWLVAPVLDAALHHAELGLHELHDLAIDEQHRVPPSAAILLGCGRITPLVSFPAAWQRTDAERCPGCCDALRYPHGTGSPVNDDGCRPVLVARFGAAP